MKVLWKYLASLIPFAVCALFSRMFVTLDPHPNSAVDPSQMYGTSFGWYATGILLSVTALASCLYWDWSKWDERRALRRELGETEKDHGAVTERRSERERW